MGLVGQFQNLRNLLGRPGKDDQFREISPVSGIIGVANPGFLIFPNVLFTDDIGNLFYDRFIHHDYFLPHFFFFQHDGNHHKIAMS
jgi:hypothetical protein